MSTSTTHATRELGSFLTQKKARSAYSCKTRKLLPPPFTPPNPGLGFDNL